ncbi:helicase [Metarhizium anisopliae BRIP 53293]|uniref:Helicase n=1 Tax=Metarhizium anisopliae BRIP 53293 TaxID=1291518 RepID=A0A0D9NID8_METAN|nr:helicase [Metarhizium anisopliae BRIP 53293]
MPKNECSEDEKDLLHWYKSLSPLRVDIVGDFAGKELFAIHGDSLMLHCVINARVDYTNGFQLLHAIFAVEDFLQNLRRRGCNFHVVWFTDHEELCVPRDASDALASGYRLTRAILIKHLKQDTGSTDPAERSISLQFEGIQSYEFQEYLTQNAIHFFLSLDGQGIDTHSAANEIRYLQFIYYLAHKGYSLAIINNLEFVHASVCSPSLNGAPVQLEEIPRTPRIPVEFICEWEARQGTSLLDGSPWEDGGPFSARDIVSLTGLSNTLLIDCRNSTKNCVVAFIIHLSVLRRLDLSQRSCQETALSELQQSSFEDFFGSFSNICTTIVEKMSFKELWDVFDLFDGRILRQILGCLQTLALPLCILREVRKFTTLIYQLTHVDLAEAIPKGQLSSNVATPTANNASKHVSPILGFSHPALDDYLASVKISTTTTVSEGPQLAPKIFKEVSHWHNARAPIDPRHKIQRQGFFAHKRNQKLMASTIAYSASLTNSSGKAIHPETIVSLSVTELSSNESKSKGYGAEDGKSQRTGHKHKKTGQGSGRRNALEAAQKLQAEKNKGKFMAMTASWNQRCQEFEAELNLDTRCLKVIKYLNGLSNQDMEIIGGETTLYLCNCIVYMLQEAKKRGKRMPEMGLLAICWSKLRELGKLPLSQEGVALFKLLTKAVKLNIEMPPDTSKRGRKLPFVSIMSTLGGQVEITVDPLEFQLTGKTFISFYAMKKVLQSNDDDVLVYVAPTKALVNQIAAEVQARFSKAYSTQGKSVWAVHTRDYRINNPTGCQVLITVPHILQIMLLAPSNSKTANSWALRVKRIIFDEVHCIGQSDDGVIWEQLLLLAPCPIIALSATVGNPMEFNNWLKGSEEAKSHNMEMIVHPYRYSDLRKFIYRPNMSWAFSGLGPAEGLPIPGLDEGQRELSPFTNIHPVASLINRNRGTIDDISFEPRDCFILWQCMSKHQSKVFPVNESLNPRNALPGNIVTKHHIVEWEVALKRVLLKWMQDPSSPFSSVRNDLQSSIVNRRLSTLDQSSNTASQEFNNTVLHDSCEETGLHTLALQLLSDLHSHAALPAILFNYDRKYCEKIVFFVEKKLRLAEIAWKASNSEWRRKLAEFEKWKKTSSKAISKRTWSHEAGLSKSDSIKEAANADISVWESFDPEAALEMFSFADRAKLLGSEFEAIVAPLKNANLKSGIVDALRRGMGIHHAGMNREYRQVVEILFRKGFLRVVVATGTLALGINMPCKSVVFFGDSVFLTALNYNQAAGRAGRRGFDSLGNVVFAGMTPERVFEIMSSRLPDLHGQFPLSTTLVLRLLGLLHHTENSEYAVKAIRSIQSQTRLYLGGPSNQMIIKHHLRFSIEYLRRQHLLSQCGTPLNFAGLVGHLYFTENAVFAFHSLLKGGYFHELCGGIHRKPQEVLLQLILVLAHLFCRVPLRSVSDEATKNIIHRSPSVVVLPPLPERAEMILCEHNHETLHIFRNYVSSFVDQHLQGQQDNQLPFTKHRVQGKNGKGALALIDPLPPTKLRSSFAALSGFNDEFQSIHDLCTTVRDGVFLEESAVPYIPIHPNGDVRLHWNAYIYDFFKHGDMEALVRDNGIKGGDVWFHLKDFSLVLATIVTSLTNFLQADSSIDDAAMVDVQDVGDVIEGKVGDEQEGPVLDGFPHATPENRVLLSQRTKKAVLADSWDDDMSTGGSQDEDTPAAEALDTPLEGPALGDNADEGLMLVLTAFRQLLQQFDEVFKKVWA